MRFKHMEVGTFVLSQPLFLITMDSNYLKWIGESLHDEIIFYPPRKDCVEC